MLLAACFCIFFFLCFILCLYCCTISGTNAIGLRRGCQAEAMPRDDAEAMPTVAGDVVAFAAGELTSSIVILRYETWFLAGKLLCDDAKALTGALLWDDALVLRFAAGVLLRLDGSRRFAPMPRGDAEARLVLSRTATLRILSSCDLAFAFGRN